MTMDFVGPKLSQDIIALDCTRVQYIWLYDYSRDACIAADINHRIPMTMQVDNPQDIIELFDKGHYQYWYKQLFDDADIASWFFELMRQLCQYKTVLITRPEAGDDR